MLSIGSSRELLPPIHPLLLRHMVPFQHAAPPKPSRLDYGKGQGFEIGDSPTVHLFGHFLAVEPCSGVFLAQEEIDLPDSH